jgi:hypothetical protein
MIMLVMVWSSVGVDMWKLHRYLSENLCLPRMVNEVVFRY